jgi:hypothetical protein
MHLLSLETAKALKEAGLKWEPQLGDYYVADYDNGLGPTKPQVAKVAEFGEPGPEHIWLPRLDQLLAEIEGLGYWWQIEIRDGAYICKVGLEGFMPGGNGDTARLKADSPEEAAAQSLLWILQKEESR